MALMETSLDRFNFFFSFVTVDNQLKKKQTLKASRDCSANKQLVFYFGHAFFHYKDGKMLPLLKNNKWWTPFKSECAFSGILEQMCVQFSVGICFKHILTN